jgi:hypothetical protein
LLAKLKETLAERRLARESPFVLVVKASKDAADSQRDQATGS